MYWYAGQFIFKLATIDTAGMDYTTTTFTITDTYSVYDSAWTHVAVAMDLTTTTYSIQLYINGVLDTTLDGTWSLDSTFVFNGAKIAHGAGG